MAHGSENVYGSEGSVPYSPDVRPTGLNQPSLGVHASPESFGAQVGRGVEKFGNTGEEIANHFAEMAVHTATNDTYVNGYAPEVNNLVSNYKKLSGTDAVLQKDAYEQQLQTINKKYLSQGSPMQQELMGQLVSRHTISTMDNISNHADQQWMQHEQTVTNQSIKNTSDEAMSNWQKPDVVDFNINRAMGLMKLDGARKVGSDPNSQPVVEQMSREAGSQVAASVIDMAIDNRDYTTANAYKNKYGDLLSGKQKLDIEKKLQDVNTNNNASNIADNLLTGKPLIPQGTQHYEDVQTKANIADLAHKNNFDSNISFALIGSESDYGRGITDKSVRKDAFQTDPKLRDEGFKDDSLESSIHNGAKIWNENSADLNNRLGRPATLSESYLAYNQGGAGAHALLTAAPTDTAIAALSKIMPANEAQRHILSNGGTATMSAADFAKNREDWFQTHYDAQKTNNTSPDAIRAQTNIQLPAIQQTSNPHELFNQMNDRLPAAQAAADNITDDKLREAAQKQIKLKYEQAKLGDTAWKNQQAQIVQKIVDDSRYTSMDEIPESIKSNLRASGQLSAMEKVFNDKNNPRAKDNTYGDMAFLHTMNRLVTDDKTDSIADIASLQKEYGDNPELHSAGFKQLQSMLKVASTPNGRAQISNQAQFLEDLRQKMVAGENDAEGKKSFEAALPLFFSAYGNATTQKQDPSDLLSFDPKNKNSFISQIKLPTSAELTSKKIDNSVSWISKFFSGNQPMNTVLTKQEQVMADYQDGKITEEQKNAQLTGFGAVLSVHAPRPE